MGTLQSVSIFGFEDSHIHLAQSQAEVISATSSALNESKVLVAELIQLSLCWIASQKRNRISHPLFDFINMSSGAEVILHAFLK